MKKIFQFRWIASGARFARSHRVAAACIVAVLAFGGYQGVKLLSGGDEGVTRYMRAPVVKGTVAVSVSGSGQVSALDQVEVKTRVSGDVAYVGVKKGQAVVTGALLAKLDTRDAEQGVGDAEISLAQARLELEKLKGLSTAEGTIRGSREKAENDLAETYEDGFNAVTNAFLELPTVMSGLQDVFYGTSLSGINQANMDYYPNAVTNATKTYSSAAYEYRDAASDAYAAARTAYDASFAHYKSASRFSSITTVSGLIDETYETAKLIAEAVKDANNLIQFYKDKLTEWNVKPNALADTQLTQLTGYTNKLNAHLSTFLSIRNAIQSNKEAFVNAGFGISDQEIKVSQAERALEDAKQKLDDCYIRAPFSGVVAELGMKQGDSVSSGFSAATIISKQKIVEITLNEVDVTKVKETQKATVTFDAIPDLTVTGTVVGVDLLGTVSQGVVSYDVELSLETKDERIKSGMSVSATVVTEVKQDVLVVPNSAIRTENDITYVEVIPRAAPGNADGKNTGTGIVPVRRTVVTGLSNDSVTEIVSGLEEGEAVVTRTIEASASGSAAGTQNAGGLRIPGLTGSGSGATFRAIR